MQRVSMRRPSKKPERLRVGVTLFLRDENQTIWENGIFQNTFFLLKTLQASPLVESTCLVACGPADPAKMGAFVAETGADIISLSEALDALDVVIELSAQLDPKWGHRFVEKGGKIVAMRVANDFVIDAERIAFGLSPGLLMSGVPYHEVWTLPAFERTSRTYYELGFRAPVRVMQHLWSPALIEAAAAAADRYGALRYRAGQRRWRVGVLEPNLSSVKTCHVPLLACEVAYRVQPRFLDTLRVFNTDQMRPNEIFINFARSLDVVQHGIATFEGRMPIYDILGSYVDVIISHHWENAQNYLYYEALYLGYPLIHNSSLIDDCGYRYADFDPEDGGRALLQAFSEHDRNLKAYHANSQRLLAKLDPTSEANVRLYSEAILSLFDAGRGTDPSLPSLYARAD